MAKKEQRFVKLLSESSFIGETAIWVDRETGVNYLWRTEGNAGGMTVLLNADGTPVITPKSQLMDE